MYTDILVLSFIQVIPVSQDAVREKSTSIQINRVLYLTVIINLLDISSWLCHCAAQQLNKKSHFVSDLEQS